MAYVTLLYVVAHFGASMLFFLSSTYSHSSPLYCVTRTLWTACHLHFSAWLFLCICFIQLSTVYRRILFGSECYINLVSHDSESWLLWLLFCFLLLISMDSYWQHDDSSDMIIYQNLLLRFCIAFIPDFRAFGSEVIFGVIWL